MVKHILPALVGGLLVLGVSTAFAEEPQMSDQEILRAWGVVPMAEEPDSASIVTELNPGLTSLSDESLDDITGAGVGVSELPLPLTLPMQLSTDQLPSLPEKPTIPEIPVGTDFFGNIGHTLPEKPTIPEMPVGTNYLGNIGHTLPEKPTIPEIPVGHDFSGKFGNLGNLGGMTGF
ncbi:MAG: hypothetical protein R3351_05060 [Nitrospirales bacterium]|nr:hypothetical protein [Nitrospirales bacterium]